MRTTNLMDLFDALREDPLRKEHPFSDDIREANDVLHYPFSSFDDRAEVLTQWCSKRQPCNFGRIAGKNGSIHFCILTDRDLARGDKAVAKKIAEDKLIWKQRAFEGRDNSPHSFMLVIASPRVALAAPDGELRRFADRIQNLADFRPTRRTQSDNGISSDLLYLRHPTDRYCYGYQFNLDFFAAAGDGRWWHDHRVPGGIAFTANATGHMKAWQEWYSEYRGQDRGEFFVKNAMYTVEQAHATHAGTTLGADDVLLDPATEGRATWLLNLVGGRPVKNVTCPFAEGAPKRLVGKDWTTYAGLLHTDHAVRQEFFEASLEAPTRSRPYLMDFTYLYDERQEDYMRFTGGVRLSEQEVYAVIGDPASWIRTTRTSDDSESVVERTAEVEAEIRRRLNVCTQWSDAPELMSPARL